MSDTFVATELLPLPSGISQEELAEVFAELDSLDDREALAILMEVTEDGSVYIPSPREVSTPQDALKNIAKQSPEAVTEAAGDAFLVMLGIKRSMVAGRF